MMEANASGNDPMVICPTEAELEAEPSVNVSCTVEGCNKIFNTSAARNIHIIQTHKIYKDDDERKRFNRSQNKNISKVIKHFYCPVRMCNRSEDWKKPFSRLSLLKQHYYSLHAEKKYPCKKCEKRFSTQSQHATHERDCGKEFFCTCGEKHNSITSLYMHAKRKQHDLPDEYCKRKKLAEPVKETFILVVPVPCGNHEDIQKAIREPMTLLPHPSTCTLLPVSENRQLISNLTQTNTSIPATATIPGQSGAVAVGGAVKMEGHVSATTSTQTDESLVIPLPPKLATSSSYAQTAHTCFPSFIPMINAPKRHKKTLAVQTQVQWTQGQRLCEMASTETQTSGGQNNTEQGNAGQGNAVQGKISLGTPSTISTHVPSLEQSISGPFFHQFPNPVSLGSPQANSSNSMMSLRPNSTLQNYGMNSAHMSSRSQSVHPDSQLDTNSTQTPWNVIAVGNNLPMDQTTPSIDTGNKISPNEVITQTDLTFQNFMEFNTSETQTLSNVIDAMTDTNESLATAAVEARSGSIPMVPGVSATSLGVSVQTNSTTLSPATSLGVQTGASSMPPAPLGLCVQHNTIVTSAPLGLGVQTSSKSMSPRPLGHAAHGNPTSMTPVPLELSVQTNANSMSSTPLELGVHTNSTSICSALSECGVQTNATMSSALTERGVQTNATSMSSAPLGLSVQTNATSMTTTPLGPIQTNTNNTSPAPTGLGIQTNVSASMELDTQSNTTRLTPAPLGLQVQNNANDMSTSPLALGVQTSGTSMSPAILIVGNPNSNMSMPSAPHDLGNRSSTTSMSPPPDVAMSGLDLLFLASTEHRANTSLGMPGIDESLCCQQTQTVFDTDTGHQETQTAWDWSLDEFSFLDQYTQTAMSAQSSTSSTTTTMPETNQFCQTGLDLCSPFAFSNTETQTVSVFDLEMFGNSISVQTEAGSASKLLGEDGPSEASKEVQVSSMGTQQEMVSADVQTEDMDFNRLRSRQVGTSQLASSHTQTSLWEDIESIIRSDSFTQTQFPSQANE